MDNLKKALTILNIEFTDEQINQYEAYMNRILELNESINLTAITDRDEFVQKHYIDSLLCADYEEFLGATTIIDVGTGGGFPGIPLAIVFPEKEFVLMDSLNKRIKVIQKLCDEIGIGNVKAIHGRAEELARQKDLRESFDICVSRAVANMSTLSEYCIPFVKEGGSFIAYKGPDCDDEIAEASTAIERLGGGEVRIEYPKMENTGFEHTLVFLKKFKKTPKSYPRKAGTPSKNPIK